MMNAANMNQQTCVSTITMRFLARGPQEQPLKDFSEMSGPMSLVLDSFVKDLRKLQRYKEKFGELSDSEASDVEDSTYAEEVDESFEDSVRHSSDGGSTTEQE